jgi:hypothetical protein
MLLSGHIKWLRRNRRENRPTHFRQSSDIRKTLYGPVAIFFVLGSVQMTNLCPTCRASGNLVSWRSGRLEYWPCPACGGAGVRVQHGPALFIQARTPSPNSPEVIR